MSLPGGGKAGHRRFAAVVAQHREITPHHLQLRVFGQQALHIRNARLAIGAGVIEELHKHDIAVFRAGPGTFERRFDGLAIETRSEEHTSELQSLMRISYAVFCLTKKKNTHDYTTTTPTTVTNLRLQ